MVSAGTRLGVYEVVVPIGSGGMGEVYRARDTRIDRHVALKVLPEAFARDGDRVLRFEREARLLGSINHPCIAALYGTEQSDGRLVLVMELVEGETLSDRILRGPMPVEEALPIARQIAEALEAAHEAGVIHRDLKPANVKITPDDRVKVLDFGLAKVADHQPAAANVTQSPTLSMATEAGVILGTAAYMSPEQAKGTAVDQRSDVFSFGCVLYEMLTGRRPFPGETTPDVLASIVARDPDYSVLPPNLNPRLYELLRRCLEKNPRRRWQAVGDLRAEIEAMIAAPRAAPAMAHAAAPSRALWRRAMPVLVTAIVVAALTSVVWWNARESPSPAQPTIRLSIRVPEGQQLPSIASRLVTISPDGMQVAYALNGLLYARSLLASDPTSIGGTEGLQASTPVFSPDGQALAFHSNRDRTLKRIALSGGAAVTIGEDIDLPYGMSWGPNGVLVGQVGRGIVRVLPNGGKPELIIPTKPGELAHGPQMLPGGNTVLFTLSTATGSEQWDGALIVVQSLHSEMRTTVIEGGSDARYLPSGHIVYAIGGSLFAVPFDVNRLEVTGGSVPVVEGVRRTPRSGTAQFAFSENGTLIYLRGPAFASFSQRDLAMIDRTGAVELLKVPRDAYESPRVSPDGKRIAVSTDTGREANIWIYDLAGASSLRRLTFGGRNRFPLWSPDGQWIVFQSDRDGDLGLFRQRADVSGTAERLTKPDPGMAHVPESWSRAGRVLSFSATTATDASLWTLSDPEGIVSRYGNIHAFNALNSSLSPDGRWMAYTMRSRAGTAVYVQPFPYTDTRFQISRDDDLGHHPLWSPDGKAIFYFPGANALVTTAVTTAPRFTFGNPTAFPGAFLSNVSTTSPRNHDVTPDGQRMVVALDASVPIQPGPAVPQFEIVLNWFDELKRRVPRRP